MSSEFRNKAVWITGASSGIGEALAYAFARSKSRLALSSNDLPELERVAARCSELGAEVLSVHLDLTELDSLPEKAAFVLSRLGTVDILINNAGISQRSLVVETMMDVYYRLMKVNFLGHVSLTKAVLPSMIAQHSGHIVVTSSVMGKYGLATRSGYCAAKHALHGFFDSLRQELWNDGIKITIACPSGVNTNVSINAVTGDGSAHGIMDNEQDNGLTPEECAEKIIKAMLQNKEEILIGNDLARHFVLIKRLFPGFSRVVAQRSVTKYLKKIEAQRERSQMNVNG